MRKLILATTAALLLALSLHCGNRQQSAQTEEKNVSDSVALQPVAELSIDDIIAFELKWAKNEFEAKLTDGLSAVRYHQPKVPDCEQCSDLERLLIYERLLTFNADRDIIYMPIPNKIKGALYHTGKNNAVTERKLKEVEAAYEKRFGDSVPWWWICSVEERIKRLEEAVKTGEGYSYYHGAEDRGAYKIGKALAAYEMWFKHRLPKATLFCEYNDPLIRVEQAIEAGLPYPLESSELKGIELKNKLNAMYEKKFGTHISGDWLSVERIHYCRERTMGSVEHISITRTASGGAVAKYVRDLAGLNRSSFIVYSLEISMDNWLDFINDLYRLDIINTWKKSISAQDGAMTKIKVFSLKTKRDFMNEYCIGDIETRSGVNFGPTPSREFERIIDNMVALIEKKGKEINDY
jgi:hypothetical protein